MRRNLISRFLLDLEFPGFETSSEKINLYLEAFRETENRIQKIYVFMYFSKRLEFILPFSPIKIKSMKSLLKLDWM